MGSISRLEAVNHMLLMAGESVVSDLDDNSGLDTETAEFVLDQFTRDFQLRGLANNRYEKKYTLTSDGQIQLPSTPYPTLSAELVSYHSNDDGYRQVGIAKGTGNNVFLWNSTDQTDTWKKDTEYCIHIIQQIDWEDLDTPVQRAVLSSAARQYQMVTQGDGDADSYLNNLEVMYNAKGKGADLDDKRASIYDSGTRRLIQAVSRNISYNDPTRFRYWRTSNG
jgi:hypothetical protein